MTRVRVGVGKSIKNVVGNRGSNPISAKATLIPVVVGDFRSESNM